jgi:hypothetical protein
VLKVVVVLGALALLARWLLPTRRISWAVPVVLGVTIVLVRTAAWLLTGD